jgi:MoaA/NifB/PqqE/SkfB family radical SAM enzyme
MKRPKNKMDIALFTQILDGSPYLERVHLTGWGEPLLNKNICEMIRIARRRGLIATIVSNATLLSEQKALEILNSGVNVITFSLDGVGETYEKVRGFSYLKVQKNILRFLELRKEFTEKPFVEINVVLFEQTAGEEKKVREEWEKKVDLVTTQPLVSQAENARGQRCLHLWRRMVVLSNGRIVPCCVDSEGELILGDANLQKVNKIFNGSRMRRLRAMHIKHKFPKLCFNCNEFYG